MTTPTKRKENEIIDSDYTSPSIGKFKWLIISVLILFLSFFINFPLKTILEGFISTKIRTIKKCPIDVQDINISFLLPSIRFNSPTFSRSCFGPVATQGLTLESLIFKLSGFGISPFGPKFLLDTKLKKSRFKLELGLGLLSQTLDFSDTVIDFDSLLPLLTSNPKLSGKININTILEIDKGQMDGAKFLIKSNNLQLYPQNLQGFAIPALPFNTLAIKGTLKDKKDVNIEQMTLGDSNSPVRGGIKGTLTLVPRNIKQSQINMNAEIFFDEEFKKSIPFLGIMLAKFPVKNGFYQIKLNGTLARPI